MHMTPTLALTLLLATVASAHAEFVMLTPEGEQPKAELPAVVETPATKAAPKTAKPARARTKTARAIARGFGRTVPLSFAVRQIVPPSIQVRYGKPEDADEFVDWQGGKAWKLVLQEAVRPLGLEVTLRGSTAFISK